MVSWSQGWSVSSMFTRTSGECRVHYSCSLLRRGLVFQAVALTPSLSRLSWTASTCISRAMDTLLRAKFIEQRANEALVKTDQARPPIDLAAIATHYGIAVRHGARGADVVAHFDDARNEMVLGGFNRWPLAHEFGHAPLGHGTVSCEIGIAFEDADGDQASLGVNYEAEANRFARRLLVPRDMTSFLLDRGLRCPVFAKRCQVSETVVSYALSFYRLI